MIYLPQTSRRKASFFLAFSSSRFRPFLLQEYFCKDFVSVGKLEPFNTQKKVSLFNWQGRYDHSWGWHDPVIWSTWFPQINLSINTKISLYMGDISKLEVDAIVNSTSSDLACDSLDSGEVYFTGGGGRTIYLYIYFF